MCAKSDDSFYLVTATGQQLKDFDWITRHIPADSDATLIDITEDIAVLSIMGPQARDRLAPFCTVDLSNEAFPFGTSRTTKVAGVTVRAIRISYVGELGWELHVAAKDAVVLWDALQPIRPIGNNAISAMRIEKAYRAMGHELSAGETPLEAGLGFAIDWDKEFIGKPALVGQKQAGIHKRLVNFVLDEPDIVLWGGEPILASGEVVGYTTSGCYGPTLGRSVAMGYVKSLAPVTTKDLAAGSFAIVQMGNEHPAKTVLSAPYDPKRLKVLC